MKVAESKGSEYFNNLHGRRKQSGRKEAPWIVAEAGTLRGMRPHESASICLRNRPVFWDPSKAVASEKTVRWDSSRPSSQHSLLKSIAKRNRAPSSSIQDSPVANRSIDQSGNRSSRVLFRTDLSGSKKVKAVLNEMNGISPIHGNSRGEKRTMSEIPSNFEDIDYRKLTTDLEEHPHQERESHGMKLQLMESILRRKEKTKSAAFSKQNILRLDRISAQQFGESSPSRDSTTREHCLLLQASNSILKQWRHSFPEMLNAIGESLTDSKTLRDRLTTIQKSFMKESHNRTSLAAELLKREENNDGQMSILLTENLFLLEGIQEAIENSLLKMQRDLKEDEIITEIFGNHQGKGFP
jgi:hypothetical protein